MLLASYEGSQKDLADDAEMSEQALTDWKNGRVKNFEPAQVFKLERALKCTPGRLSSHLGFLPLAAAGGVEAAILASDLPGEARSVLLEVYKQFSREHGGVTEGPDDSSEAN